MLNEEEKAELYERLPITEEDMERLSGLCKIGSPRAAHDPSRIVAVEGVLHQLLVEMEVAPGSKVLDLGCGFGFPLLAFAYAGLRPYGVERELDVIRRPVSNIRDAPKLLEKEFEHKPILACFDYFDIDFPSFTFFDGTTPRDMDIFFCHFYLGEHHEDVAKSLHYAKDGAVLTLPKVILGEDLSQKCGFRGFNGHFMSYLVRDRLIG